ncbi:MAG: EscT/YscT/HrcT family type III secretion system export apparatus protein [Victivallaceae bacterium]
MATTLPKLLSSLDSVYFNFIFQKHPAIVWQTFLLLMARVLPIFAIVPYLGAKLLPSPIKLGVSITYMAIAFPKILMDTTFVQYNSDALFYLLILKEVFIGCLMGFIAAFPFYATQSAGSFIANQQGIQGMEGAISMISMEQSAPQGILYHYMATLIFWLCGGPIILMDLITFSLQVIPLSHFLPPDFMSMHTPFWVTMIKICQLCLVVTIQLGAPATLAMLLSDLFLGIINRMAPQVQVIYLLSALKAFMGLLFLTISWWFILKQLDLFVVAWLKKMRDILFG